MTSQKGIPKKVHISPIITVSYNRGIVDFLGNSYLRSLSIVGAWFVNQAYFFLYSAPPIPNHLLECVRRKSSLPN